MVMIVELYNSMFSKVMSCCRFDAPEIRPRDALYTGQGNLMTLNLSDTVLLH